MAIDKDSTKFTLTFATVMVVVVGAILALISMGLKPMQKANEADKKKIDILGAIGVEASRADASELYDKYVTSSLVINYMGEEIEGEAFTIDVKKQYRDKNLTIEDKKFPLFIAEKDGEKLSIVPMVGTGLWGPIWGFMALKEDNNTVYGATFDHKTETPGLGAEIKQDGFEKQFPNEKLYSAGGGFESITVKKGGAEKDDPHAVDAITGGTITSDGVNAMIKSTLKIYGTYLKPQ